MALVPSVPPKQLIDEVSNRIGWLVQAPGDHFLKDLSINGLELAAPHRVYVLPFDAVSRQDLSHARPPGWQFLVLARDTIIASAEVADEAAKSVAVSGSPFAESIGDVIDRIEDLQEVRGGDYELRILRVNSLYIVAAWVVGDQRMVIPLAPAPEFIETGKVYTERGFLEALNRPGIEPFGAQRRS